MIRSNFLACFCLATALSAMLPFPAVAEEAPRKALLLTNKPTDPFVERIKAEVVGLGLKVLIRAPSGPLEEDARGQHVTVAIRVLPTNNGVEVWMADETSGRSLLRQLIVDERPEGPDHDLIALQTAELLRTSLFAKPADPAPNPPVTQPPPTKIASTPEPAPGTTSISGELAPEARTGAQVGLGPLLSPGGAGPELQVWLSLRHFFGHRVGLGLDFSLPIARSSLEGPEGTARLGCVMAGGSLLARVGGGHGWTLTSALGAGVLRVGIDGQAAPTLTSSTTSVLTGAGHARVEGGYALTDWLRLGGLVLGGAALDRVHLRFAGNDAGSWGRLFAIATLFAEAGF